MDIDGLIDGLEDETLDPSFLGDLSAEELLGALGKAKKRKKKKAAKKLAKAAKSKLTVKKGRGGFVKSGGLIKTGGVMSGPGLVKTGGANFEFQKRMSQLPADVQRDLRTGARQIVDKIFYVTKYCSSGATNVDMFQSGDTKQEGYGNLLQGRLGANDYFLITGIRLLSASSNSTTTIASLQDAMKADFGAAELVPEVANGEFSFLNEQTNYADETSCQVFKHFRTDIPRGFYKLETPKLFKANRSIKLNLKFATGLTANTAIRCELYGALTVQGAN